MVIFLVWNTLTRRRELSSKYEGKVTIFPVFLVVFFPISKNAGNDVESF